MKEIKKKKHLKGYLFILPLFIPLLIFNYYPPISGIYHSFFDWNYFGNSKFIFFDNYIELFSDQVFLGSIPTMFKLLVPRLLISIIVPFIAAEMIFAIKSSKLKYGYRVMVLLPMIAPGVVGMMMWRFIYDPTNGLATTLAQILNFVKSGTAINWLGDPNLVIPAVVFIGFPWIGGTAVLIYMSGLMGISSEVIEATKLDGCSTFRRIISIDIPQLIGQIRYFLIFGIIGGLQDFGTQIVLTRGGPGYSTYVPGYHMYMEAFNAQRMGYACAIGTTMFLVIFIITVLTFRFVKSKN